MGAVAGVFGDILITSPPSVALAANYVLTDAGDHKTFNNPTPSQRYWDDTFVPVVQTSPDGTTWTTVTVGFTIRYLTGQIVFAVAVTGATPGVRISSGGKYFPYASIGNTTDWTANPAIKAVDATTHKGVGGSPYEDYLLTTMGATFTFNKWWIDQTFINLLLARTRVITSCVDPQGGRYEAYGYIMDDAIKLATAALVDQAITFQCSGSIVAI
jgi:hypothetical protein